MVYLTFEKEANGLCSGRLASSLHNIIEVAQKDVSSLWTTLSDSIVMARKLAELFVRTVQFGSAEPFFPGLCCIYRADEQSWQSAILWPRRKEKRYDPCRQ